MRFSCYAKILIIVLFGTNMKSKIKLLIIIEAVLLNGNGISSKSAHSDSNEISEVD